jgi:NAD(P)-dependent dehydrogenase (short-subunit alcohol dehydrogenase family)
VDEERDENKRGNLGPHAVLRTSYCIHQEVLMSEERVILVTGSSSGLGAALVEHFAGRGFGVVINYIVEEEAQSLYDRLAQTTDASKLMKYKANVAERGQVKAMFDAVIDKFGRVDILVNCDKYK